MMPILDTDPAGYSVRIVHVDVMDLPPSDCGLAEEHEANVQSLMDCLAIDRSAAEGICASVDQDHLADGPICLLTPGGFRTRYTPAPGGTVLGEVAFPTGGGGAFIGPHLAGAKKGLDEIIADHQHGRPAE